MPPGTPMLLVEDDDLDAMIVRRSLNELGIANPLIRKKDGEEALEYLIARSDRRPCVILLDLNMPRMNGFEFLRHIKTRPELKDIPVVVVSTSTSNAEISRSLELGACAYVVKSMDSKEFQENLGRISDLCYCSHCTPARCGQKEYL